MTGVKLTHRAFVKLAYCMFVSVKTKQPSTDLIPPHTGVFHLRLDSLRRVLVVQDIINYRDKLVDDTW